MDFDARFHLNRRCFYPFAGLHMEAEGRAGRIYINLHGLAPSHLASKDALGERRFNLALDGALQRSRSVVRIVPTSHKTRTSRIR